MVEFEPIGAGVGENEADVDEKPDWGDYAQRTLGSAAAPCAPLADEMPITVDTVSSERYSRGDGN